MGRASTAVNKKGKVKEPKEKKSNARVDHPCIAKLKKDEKISEIPDDFDFEKHRPIKRTLWARDDMFFDQSAAKHEHEAKGLRAKAEECRMLGSAAERTRTKRLLKMQEKINELKNALTEKGIDVEALLKSVA